MAKKLTLRQVKGSKLTIQEMDENFEYLDEFPKFEEDGLNNIIPSNGKKIPASVIDGGSVAHDTLANRDIAGNHEKLIPSSDSTTAIQITELDGTVIVNVDSVNDRVGINTEAPITPLHVVMQDNDAEDDHFNDIVADGDVDADKGFAWAENGERIWQQNIYRDELGKYMYFYNFKSRRELMVMSDRMKVGINTNSNILDYHSTWMDPENGLLNDCEVGGVYGNTDVARFEIKISTTGAIDKFIWRYSINYGQTWSAWSAEINCSVIETELFRGVTIFFKSANGHNLLDSWQVNVFPQEPQATLQVKPTMIDEIGCIKDITADPIVYIDQTHTLQNNDMPDQNLFTVGDNSMVYIGRHVKFANLFFDIITAGIDVTSVVEFWNGTAWTEITVAEHLIDGTNNFTQSGNIHWNIGSLTGWVKRNPEYHPNGDGYNLYWVRFSSSTTIAQSPVIRTITPAGYYRFATYAAHNDSRPSFYVDPRGHGVFGDASIPASSSLNINGSIAYKTNRITTDITLDQTYNLIYCTNTTPITISLPEIALNYGRTYRIVIKGTGKVFLSPFGSDTMEGVAGLYECIIGKAYLISTCTLMNAWVITNNVKNIIASEISFAPDGNITSTNIQGAVVEVRDDAAGFLDDHVTDYGNPHQVVSDQVAYVNTIFDTVNTEEILDQYSEIINNTLGSGVLENKDYLVYNVDPTLLDVEGGTGYLTYENYFKKLTWLGDTVDFSLLTVDKQYYVYVDINGDIQTSVSSPSVTQTIILGRVYWSGEFLANASQAVRIAKDSLANIYTYLVRLGGFISDSGCLASIITGVGNEMKLISTQGTVWRGLKEYHFTDVDTTETTRYTVYYGTTESWYKNYYEDRFLGDITSAKWNDRTKSKEVQYGGHILTFLNGSTTVTCPDDLTADLSVGDMIWLYDDGVEHMNNIETIVFGAITTITLSLPYSGSNSVGMAAYTQALPNIPSGKFVKHMLIRGLDDNMVLFLGQKLYDTQADALADGAPETSDTFKTTGVMIAFITVEQGDTTLVGKLQDIRPLPFNSRIGGASGGVVSTSHSTLTDLGNDDHLQYLLANGSRNLSAIQKYASHPTFTTDLDLIDKKYGDDLISTHESTYDHNNIAHTQDVILKHGIESRDDSTLPLVMDSATFSIIGSNFNIWNQGVKYVKNTETIEIDDVNGIHYIMYDANGDLISRNTSMWDIYTEVPVAFILWDGTEGLVHDERHNSTRNLDWHLSQHLTVGVKYGSGLDIDTISNGGFVIGEGDIWDEDLQHIIPEQTECRIYYRAGPDWTWTTKQGLYYLEDTGVVQYDDVGVVTPCTLDYYTCWYMFGTGNYDCPIVVIAAQRQDATLQESQINSNYEDLVLPDNIMEYKVLHRIFVKNSVGNYYVSDDDYRNVPSLTNRQNGLPHNILTDTDSLGCHPALAVNTNTTNFSGLLTTDEKTVQLALDKLSAVTINTLGIGSVTDDAQLKRAAADFESFDEKIAPISADIVLIEDSADTYAKKKMQLGNFQKQSITFEAGRSGNNNSNIDLNRAGGIPTNTSPFVVPINATLKSISASSSAGTNETWTASILVNDVQVATLAITTADSAYRSDLAVDITAGDKVRIRFLVGNTGAVNSPTVSIFIIEK